MERPARTPSLQPFPELEPTARLGAAEAAMLLRRRVPVLRVAAGPDLLRYAVLEPGRPVLVGRGEECDLPLQDVAASRRHAVFRAEPSGTVRVEDLGSTNGTWIDGEAVRRKEVGRATEVEIGHTLLRLEWLTGEELAHLSRVAEQLDDARRDRLTGLLTRNWLDRELDAFVERCEAARVPLSCAFLDIDHFKRINDRWGHRVGDEVLASVGRLLLVVVRERDPAVRYGGEELLVLLPGSGVRQAVRVAGRIRRRVAEHDWSRTAESLSVTLSAGVAERLPGEAPRRWLERADEALYRAKRAGRNRVRSAG